MRTFGQRRRHFVLMSVDSGGCVFDTFHHVFHHQHPEQIEIWFWNVKTLWNNFCSCQSAWMFILYGFNRSILFLGNDANQVQERSLSVSRISLFDTDGFYRSHLQLCIFYKIKYWFEIRFLLKKKKKKRKTSRVELWSDQFRLDWRAFRFGGNRKQYLDILFQNKRGGEGGGHLEGLQIVKMSGHITGYWLTVPKGRIKVRIGFGAAVQHSAGPSVCVSELTGPWQVVLDEKCEKEGD